MPDENQPISPSPQPTSGPRHDVFSRLSGALNDALNYYVHSSIGKALTFGPTPEEGGGAANLEYLKDVARKGEKQAPLEGHSMESETPVDPNSRINKPFHQFRQGLNNMASDLHRWADDNRPSLTPLAHATVHSLAGMMEFTPVGDTALETGAMLVPGGEFGKLEKAEQLTLREELEAAAKKHEVEYRGIQEGVSGKYPDLAIFQDPKTQTSVGVKLNEWSPEKLKEHLDAARDRIKEGGTSTPSFESIPGHKPAAPAPSLQSELLKAQLAQKYGNVEKKAAALPTGKVTEPPAPKPGVKTSPDKLDFSSISGHIEQAPRESALIEGPKTQSKLEVNKPTYNGPVDRKGFQKSLEKTHQVLTDNGWKYDHSFPGDFHHYLKTDPEGGKHLALISDSGELTHQRPDIKTKGSNKLLEHVYGGHKDTREYINSETLSKGKQGGHAGGGVASEEELARSEVFVKYSRSGQPTYLGKQPDANLKAGEAVIAVNPKTGATRVQNSAAGVDTAKFEKHAKETYAKTSEKK